MTLPPPVDPTSVLSFFLQLGFGRIFQRLNEMLMLSPSHFICYGMSHCAGTELRLKKIHEESKKQVSFKILEDFGTGFEKIIRWELFEKKPFLWFLDAIASPSTYPDHWVSQSVSE